MCPPSVFWYRRPFFVPSFRFLAPSFRFCTLVLVLGVKEHPPKPPFCKPPTLGADKGHGKATKKPRKSHEKNTSRILWECVQRTQFLQSDSATFLEGLLVEGGRLARSSNGELLSAFLHQGLQSLFTWYLRKSDLRRAIVSGKSFCNPFGQGSSLGKYTDMYYPSGSYNLRPGKLKQVSN